MSDIRQEIARRHGIPELADRLVGETPAELNAFAAAVAALRTREAETKAPESIGDLTVQAWGDFEADRNRHDERVRQRLGAHEQTLLDLLESRATKHDALASRIFTEQQPEVD